MWLYFWILFIIGILAIVLFLVFTFLKNKDVVTVPEIIYPQNEAYKKFNFGKKRPDVVHRPMNKENLLKLLENLQRSGQSYFILNKGYPKREPTGTGIDLSSLEFIDVSNTYVRVGATTLVRDIFEKCLENKLYLPFDVGHLTIEEALILGIGSTVRKHGFLADNVLEMEIILADGTIQTINPDHQLFSPVLKASPGTFGIIVSYTFKTFSFPWSLLSFHLKYQVTQLQKILAWASARRRRRTTSDLNLSIQIKNSGIEIKGIFMGNEDALARRLREIFILPVVEKEIEELSSNDMLKYVKKIASNSFRKTKSHFGREKLPDKISEMIIKTLSELHLDVGITFYLLPGPYLIVYKVEWDEYDEQETNVPWELDQIEALYQKVEPFVTPLCYSGFPDPTLSDSGKSYYGKDHVKLVRLKKRFDPSSFFYDI